ncbi:MAG: acyl-CoA thioesterase [Polyangiaceae bacterium]|nr:acyl-CoA thioesterase [Polyangiaceae bacterium]
MVIYERPVRMEDIDAAGIVFFPRFFVYAFEAMEHFVNDVPGRHLELFTKERIGFPVVRAACDYRVPLRYGDVIRMAISVTKIGTTSCSFRYDITRVPDGADVATVEHVVVATDLKTLTKIPLPDDIRSLLGAHLIT